MDDQKFRRISLVLILLTMLVIFISLIQADNEQREEQRKISIVLYNAGEGAFESMLLGINQAKKDFDVNTTIIVSDQDNENEQINMALEEIKNGANAVIIASADSEQSVLELNQYSDRIPIITMESRLSDGSYLHFGADDYEMGRLLAGAIKEDMKTKEELTLGMIISDEKRDSIRQRMKGFREHLPKETTIVTISDPKDYASVDGYLAFDDKELELLAESLDQFGKRTPIYGIGNSPKAVSSLKKGIIHALVVQDEFTIGYLSLEAAVRQIEGKSSVNSTIRSLLVRTEDITEPVVERLLFPIVR